MAVVIDFNKYIEAEEDKKQCIRLKADLLVKRDGLMNILDSLQRTRRCSLNIRGVCENQEYVVYGELFNIITDSIRLYIANIDKTINQLGMIGVSQ